MNAKMTITLPVADALMLPGIGNEPGGRVSIPVDTPEDYAKAAAVLREGDLVHLDGMLDGQVVIRVTATVLWMCEISGVITVEA